MLCRGGRDTIIGLITAADLTKVDSSGWTQIPVSTEWHPLAEVRSVSPNTPVAEALQTMGREDLNQLPVVEAGRMEGMLSRGHILQALQAEAN